MRSPFEKLLEFSFCRSAVEWSRVGCSKISTSWATKARGAPVELELAVCSFTNVFGNVPDNVRRIVRWRRLCEAGPIPICSASVWPPYLYVGAGCRESASSYFGPGRWSKYPHHPTTIREGTYGGGAASSYKAQAQSHAAGLDAEKDPREPTWITKLCERIYDTV